MTDSRHVPPDLELETVLQADARRLASRTAPSANMNSAANRLIVEQNQRSRRAIRRRSGVLLTGLLAASATWWMNPTSSPIPGNGRDYSMDHKQAAVPEVINPLRNSAERFQLGGNESLSPPDVVVPTGSDRPATREVANLASTLPAARRSGSIRTVKLSDLPPAERLAIQTLYGLPQRPPETPPF